MGEQIIFYGMAALVCLFSVLVISLKNPVASAICLVVDLFLLAGIYAQMGAEFVAAIQVLVYAGAIVILFLFVIMLINFDDASLKPAKWKAFEYFSLFLLGIGSLIFLYKLGCGLAGHEVTVPAIANYSDNTYSVAMTLFLQYVWPFELASLLILLAVIASIVIAKKPKEHA